MSTYMRGVISCLCLSLLCACLVEASVTAVWHYDEGTGTTVSDTSGNGHTGTFTPDAAWASGHNGGSAGSFDDVRYVEVTDTTGLRTDVVTQSAWVKLTATGSSGCDIVSFGDATVLRMKTDASAEYVMYDGTSFFVPTGGSGLLDDTWHHLVGTYDQSFMRLYVDNVEVDSVASTNPMAYGAPDIRMGHIGQGSGENNNCTGLIDEVTTMDSYCDATCVTALFNAGSSRRRIITGIIE